jgi:hypothetical protein
MRIDDLALHLDALGVGLGAVVLLAPGRLEGTVDQLFTAGEASPVPSEKCLGPTTRPPQSPGKPFSTAQSKNASRCGLAFLLNSGGVV